MHPASTSTTTTCSTRCSGYLAWTLDGRELPEVLRERILRPLGMSQSEPVITLDVREKTVKNYASFLGDRPYPRNGRLSKRLP